MLFHLATNAKAYASTPICQLNDESFSCIGRRTKAITKWSVQAADVTSAVSLLMKSGREKVTREMKFHSFIKHPAIAPVPPLF